MQNLTHIQTEADAKSNKVNTFEGCDTKYGRCSIKQHILNLVGVYQFRVLGEMMLLAGFLFVVHCKNTLEKLGCH